MCRGMLARTSWGIARRRAERGDIVTMREKWRRLLWAGIAAPLTLLVAGCAGGDERREASAESPAVERLCGNASVSTQTRQALELITGAKRADVVDDRLTLAGAAEELNRRRQSTTRGYGEICRLYASRATGAAELRVFWNLMADVEGKPAPKFTMLPMGERAGAAWDGGYVMFACTRRGGAPGTSPYVASVFVRSSLPIPEPEGGAKNLKNAYATMAHAFALAMVKELDCADDAGLPAEPVLIP